MRIFFWQYDDYNDIQRQWAMFIVNLLAVIFTANALINTVRYYRRCMFQLVPLSINFIATFILLLLKLFERGYQFDQVGYIVQIFTYFLFCYTFALMYTKVTKTRLSRIMKKAFNILLVIFVIGFITTSTLVFTKVISKSCDRNIFAPALISFLSELISFFPAVYYGCKILTHLIKSERKFLTQISTSEYTANNPSVDSNQQSVQSNSNPTINLNSINVLSSSSDQYIRERKKQVVLVILGYCSSLIMRATLLFLTEEFKDYFNCSLIDQVYIITSDQTFGQIILIVIELNQLLPHIIIPIALYIVPIRKKQKGNQSIVLEETLLQQDGDEQETFSSDKSSTYKFRGSTNSSLKKDEDFNYSNQRNNDQIVKSRISSLMKSKYKQREESQQ